MPANFPTIEDFEQQHDSRAVDRISEHGQEWLICRHCGAMASIVEYGDEQETWETIEEGDETCRAQGIEQ